MSLAAYYLNAVGMFRLVDCVRKVGGQYSDVGRTAYGKQGQMAVQVFLFVSQVSTLFEAKKTTTNIHMPS